MTALVCDRSHLRHYGDGERRYYAVSQVLDVLVKRVGITEPTPAMVRGTDLHTICALEAGASAGLCARPNVPEEYLGPYEGFRAWLRARRPKILAIEQASRHPFLPYAGTPDLVCQIGRTTYVLDIKTGAAQPWHRLQVMAYSRLELCRGAKPALLYLDAEGKHPGIEYPKPTRADWAAFQSALNILIWRES
jgi:hypothetical protein